MYQPALKVDKNYGTDNCHQKPDMSNADFEAAKVMFYKKLELNCKNPESIERKTIKQSECEDWLILRRELLTESNFGKIIRARPSSYPKLCLNITLFNRNNCKSIKLRKGK